MTIGIINYRVGNLQNLQNGLDFIGAGSKIVNSPEQMKGIKKFILPGVGAFGQAAFNLRKYKFWQPLLQTVADGVPLLGICVGMQLLFTSSSEDGEHKGLDLIPGRVKRFETKLKVPQMGWNRANFSQPDPLLEGIKKECWFYFVHSFACYPDDRKLQLGTTNYEHDFCSIVKKNNLRGVQFHPEKSQNDGLQLLRNFVEKC